MKITAIKAQVKRAGRYSIFVDEKYAFSLSDTALLEQKIFVGQELSAEELKSLKRVSAEDKIYERALHYAILRPRSRWEMQTYLVRKGSPAPLSEQIMNKLADLGLLDDEKFARSFVADRRLLRSVSKRKLQQELMAKHVSREVIGQVLGEDETDEREVLRTLIAQKRRRYPDRLKFMQYLARQGFNYDDIKAALTDTE